MVANPVLAKFVRGNTVENMHRGAFCVTDADGNIIAAEGYVDRPVFPRSAIKSIQALAIFRSGADKKFALTEKDLAIACSSHHAEQEHAEAVTAFLERVEFSIADLECGAHVPTNREARNQIKKEGAAPTQIHNNCSGKHTGMLAVAKASGQAAKHYVAPDHPVQEMVRQCVEEVIGTRLSADACGTDGCSIPTYAAPLKNFAQGFAKMATGQNLSAEDAAAAKKLFDAMVKYPTLVAGSNAIDTVLMEVFGDNLVLKLGAEGVYCGAIRDKGWGFALKCDDGNMKAAEAMVSALIAGIAAPSLAQTEILNARRNQPSKNWNKIEVGSMQATDLAQPKL